MKMPELLMVIALILNVLVVAAYLIVTRLMHKERRNSSLIKAAVMLLCPVCGPLFFLLGYLSYLLFRRKDVDLEDVIFSKERVRTYSPPEEEKERNIVPLEEAIAVTDTENLRNLMMKVVCDNRGETLAAIGKGLYSDDSETSHYAASVLQEKLGRFRGKVQSDYRALRRTEEEKAAEDDAARTLRASRALELLEYMIPMLKRGVFGDAEQRSFVQILDGVGEILMETDSGRMDSYLCEDICHLALDADEDAAAEKWSSRMERDYPGVLGVYTCKLHMYYKQGRREQFLETLAALKKSDVVIDANTLELIRAFS